MSNRFKIEGTQLTEDMVNHPTHYMSNLSGVECINITEHYNFNLGNALKYLFRHEKKNGLEDLKKAVWYVNREMERVLLGGKSFVPDSKADESLWLWLEYEPESDIKTSFKLIAYHVDSPWLVQHLARAVSLIEKEIKKRNRGETPSN